MTSFAFRRPDANNILLPSSTEMMYFDLLASHQDRVYQSYRQVLLLPKAVIAGLTRTVMILSSTFILGLRKSIFRIPESK